MTRDCAEDYLANAKAAAGMFARRYPQIGYDEFLSAAYWGLVEAERRFDPAKGVQFDTYATHRVKGSCLDLVRKTRRDAGWNRLKREQRFTWRSLDEMPAYELDRYVRVASMQVQTVEARERRDHWRSLLQAQPERIRRVLSMVVRGASAPQVAASVGVSPTRVRQLVSAFLSQLRVSATVH